MLGDSGVEKMEVKGCLIFFPFFCLMLLCIFTAITEGVLDEQ